MERYPPTRHSSPCDKKFSIVTLADSYLQPHDELLLLPLYRNGLPAQRIHSDLSLLLTSRASSSNLPCITSAVDDVMYIVNNLLQPALHTTQRALASNKISTVGRVLRSDFVSMIQRKIQVESYPKSCSGIPRAQLQMTKSSTCCLQRMAMVGCVNFSIGMRL